MIVTTTLARRFAWAALPVLLLHTACTGAGTTRGATAVRDSAGIRIVESAAPVSSVAWTVNGEPDVVIGGDVADSAQQLFRVAGAVGLRDGRTVVAHGPAPMVRWYDATGAFQFGTGRPGGGPGEFGGGEGAWIFTLWPLPGDSVATWEHPPRRMQVFGPDGRFARAVVLDLPPAMPIRSYPQIVGRQDGGFVAFISGQSEPGALGEVVRPEMPFVRYRPDGGFAGEIARLPGFMVFTRDYRMPDGRETRTTGRPPFAKAPSAWASEDRFYYGSGDRYEIAVYDSLASLIMLIRRPIPNRAVTPEHVETYKSETMAGAPDDPAARRSWQEQIDAAPYPDSFPAYRRIRADRLGMLWVQEYDLPGADSVTWSVFDREGRWSSDVTIPRDWQVLDIGADFLLVLLRDDLDVERVERHTLVRR